jgi:hypothetical protein
MTTTTHLTPLQGLEAPTSDDLGSMAEMEAKRFETWDNEAGKFFAEAMRRLAQLFG